MNLDITGVSVMLAMPTHRDLHPLTVRALLETQAEFIRRGRPIGIEMMQGSSLVHHARTKVAHSFLSGDWSHLFWVDSDIVWTAEQFVRVVALATVMECVSGIYTCKTDPPTFCLNVEGGAATWQSNEYGCLPMRGVGLGLGFTCVQRKVMEELAARAPKLRFPQSSEPIPSIFRCDAHNGDARGEDMAFFADVADLGYVAHLDPSVTLGHIGPKEYRASILDYLQQEETSPSTEARANAGLFL